ncbi:MAG: hypothetical protein HYV18_02220 [Gammaproteobacteria bacterium]|nr:hypothetical protein [Gammaproteobacteria bacterium]
MSLWLDSLLLDGADRLYSLLPRRRPPAERLAACKLISHRGERDDRTVFENTYAAFDPLRGSGVFGIEFDVRWTADQVPVVIHDATLERMHLDPARVRDLTWDELRRRHPQVPDLHGLVRRYCGEFHLMVELKREPLPDPERQQRRLLEALAPALEAGRCHVISLWPPMFRFFPRLPPARTLGVARTNVDEISAEALQSGRGGLTTQYMFLRERHVRHHHQAGQRVGSGFVHSRSVLFRELNRGVDWIFTNRARAMQCLLDRLRGAE